MIQMNVWLILFVSIMAQVDYGSLIQPIFNERCISCHGSMGGLNMTSYENLFEGGISGAVVIPYDYVSSELWQRINTGQMPPGNNDLYIAQVDLIAQWIDEGALSETSDCDPDLSCGAALTCCNNLLYPSICCDENCDEAIGECGNVYAGDLNVDGILNVLDVVLLVNSILDL